jgi:hypothetical protein
VVAIIKIIGFWKKKTDNLYEEKRDEHNWINAYKEVKQIGGRQVLVIYFDPTKMDGWNNHLGFFKRFVLSLAEKIIAPYLMTKQDYKMLINKEK